MSLGIAFRHRFPGIAFEVSIEAPGGVTVLFGPSGAGKSTVAAVVAGLLRPLQGRVEIDGVVLADSAAGIFVAPERRRIGFVFQDARLFPHLSVAGNLRFGLRRVRAPGGARPIGWDEVVGLLGVADLLGRRPSTLSGGERQRVAIGRALLSQPRLLVMDEPLAGLDGARRAEILPYLARLRDALALPILYVTHALDEVARLADTLVLIEHGRSIAAGPLAEMAARADLPIAARDDAGAVLSCTVLGHLGARGLTRLGLAGAPGLELLVPLLALPAGGALRVRVNAAEVILATTMPSGISVQNILPARVAALVGDAATASTLVELRLGTAPFLARVTPDAVTRLGLVPGCEVLALIKSVSVQILADPRRQPTA
jgi:molybdate transport system ATP-binding protein